MKGLESVRGKHLNDISLTVTVTVAIDTGHHPSSPSKTRNHQLKSRLGDTKAFSFFFFLNIRVDNVLLLGICDC